MKTPGTYRASVVTSVAARPDHTDITHTYYFDLVICPADISFTSGDSAVTYYIGTSEQEIKYTATCVCGYTITYNDYESPVPYPGTYKPTTGEVKVKIYTTD